MVAEVQKPIVYVAGLYRGKSRWRLVRAWEIFRNIVRARECALRWWTKGHAVICPHSNTAFMDGLADDSVWLTGDLELMRGCGIIVMLDGWDRSLGAIGEHQFALEEVVAKQSAIIVYDPEQKHSVFWWVRHVILRPLTFLMSA